MPANLSGGMKKRVSIARALALNPEVILYDEPTAGLDPPMSENIDDLILELNKKIGITTIVVTHDLHSIFKIADTIYMLHEGKIIEGGDPAEFRKSENPVVRSFLHRMEV
jgi:phospholipid/cholesterol/gamma-HCH transport system ATP-binding protein